MSLISSFLPSFHPSFLNPSIRPSIHPSIHPIIHPSLPIVCCIFHCGFRRLEAHFAFNHTIPISNNPEIETFWKNCGKRRKCGKPVFSPFPTIYSTLPKSNFNFSVLFILLSANASNLDRSKILSLDTGLTPFQTTNFRPFQTDRLCRRQFPFWLVMVESFLNG